MARPRNCRRVGRPPATAYFKPKGVPASSLEEIVLLLDELEALRLADLEGCYQEAAAQAMNVSRATFGRIVESARRKVAEALVEGRALRIEGGNIEMTTMRTFQCGDCEHRWEVAHGTGRPQHCPVCKSGNIHRAEEERGYGAPGGRRGRRHRGGPVRA